MENPIKMGVPLFLETPISGWRFQVFVYFYPDPWGDDPI